jgi:hypothetical protein
LLAGLAVATAPLASAQSGTLTLPPSLVAGSAFSMPTSGSGKAVLYIVGPGQALRSDVQLGEAASFPAGELYNAGHYVVILAGATSTATGEFDVVPALQPETLGFLAKPSRLPVGLHNGISGAVYVFDAYHNLILTPMPVSLALSSVSSAGQSKTVTTRNGLAWGEMDSAPKEGAAKFVAKAGDVSSTRVIDQVPGDPCSIKISAQPDGKKLLVQTAPVRDCSGNAIPDGTIVTFTETLNDVQSAVDVPLKQGIARVDMPATKGSKISAASGVVAGNEIVWEGP